MWYNNEAGAVTRPCNKMPNYDFNRDAFHIFFSNGDELAYLDRESVSALSTVLSAALNADEVEMPVQT